MKKINRNEFVDDCEESLRSHCARFGLKLVGTKLEKWFSVVSFANDTSGVVFHHELRDNLVQVELAELKAGEIIPMPLLIHDDSAVSTVPLCDVLFALGTRPEACQSASSKASLRQQIDSQVRALAEHATCVLEGDFSSFNDAVKQLKSRLNARRGQVSADEKEAFLSRFPQMRKYL